MSVNCTHEECANLYECALNDDLAWPLELAARYFDRLIELTTEPVETYYDIH